MTKYPINLKEDSYNIHSSFHQFIFDRIGKWNTKSLHIDIGISGHLKTKIYKNPEKCPPHVVLLFSKHFDIDPYLLITKYKLGVKMNQLFIEHFKEVYKLKQMQSEQAA